MADGQMKASVTNLLDCSRGIAWPSSVRTARRSVKSDNERDLRHHLLSSSPEGEHYGGTAAVKAEEGGGNGRSVCPESPGLHARYKGQDNGLRHRKVKAILKPARNSD